MNMRFVNRLKNVCLCVIAVAAATLLISRLWGGPSDTLSRIVRIFDLIAMAGLVFYMVRLYQCGILCADGLEDDAVRKVILVPKGYPVKNFKYTGNFVYDDEAFWRIE